MVCLRHEKHYQGKLEPCQCEKVAISSHFRPYLNPRPDHQNVEAPPGHSQHTASLAYAPNRLTARNAHPADLAAWARSPHYSILGHLIVASVYASKIFTGKIERLHSPPCRVLHNKATDQRTNLRPDEGTCSIHHHWCRELLHGEQAISIRHIRRLHDDDAIEGPD